MNHTVKLDKILVNSNREFHDTNHREPWYSRHFIFFLIYKSDQKGRVFVPGRPFKVSIMFTQKNRSLP